MSDPTTIEEQAAQLAQWLDEHPGSAPPDGVDPDVLETIYALRPDLAPAPSFSIDDILGDITSGPFAEPAGAEIVPLPAPVTTPEPEPVPELEPEHDAAAPIDLATERRRRRPWLWSGVGAVAAAAMALVVAIPHLDTGISDEALYAPLQQPSPSAAPEPATIAELEPEAEAEESADRWESGAKKAEADELTAGLLEGALAEAQQEPPLLDAVAGGGTTSTTTAAGPAAPGATAASETYYAPAEIAGGELSEAKERKDELSRDGVAPARRASSGEYAQPQASPTIPELTERTLAADAGVSTDAPAPPADLESLGGMGYLSDPAPPPEALAQPVEESEEFDMGSNAGADYGAVAGFDDFEDLADEDADGSWADMEIHEEERSRERKKDQDDAGASDRRQRGAEEETLSYETASVSRGGYRSPRLGAGRSGRASKARPATEQAYDAVEPAEPAPAPTPPSGSTALDLDHLRAQANPLDYSASWYLSDPSIDEGTRARVAAAYGAVQSAVVEGDAGGSDATLESLLTSGNAKLVQDAAFRLATLQLQQGQRNTALATVNRGLAASASPTVFRSRLLALQGSILEEQGDVSGAIEAYQRAVDANATRY